MTRSDHAGRIDAVVAGEDANDRGRTRETEVPVVLVFSMDRNRIGVPFDIDGDIGIGVEYFRQLAESFFAFGIDDGATGGEQEVLRQAHVYFAVFYRYGQLIGFETYEGIRHFFPD